MPAWIIPALKAILPYTGDIIDAARPMFTKRKGGGAADAPDVQQQIEELQTAATQNDTHIRELAEQIKVAVDALEQAGAAAEQKLQRYQRLAVVSVALSALSLTGVVLLLLRP